MSACFYVYVGLESTTNFQTGEARGVWGWRSEALGQRRNPDRRMNREIARSIRWGDYLIFGYMASPGPRSKDHEFPTGTLRRLLITRVVRPLYESDEQVWDDDVYPERVDLEVVDAVEQVEVAGLGTDVIKALKSSGTRGCVPVEGPAIAASILVPPESNESGALDGLDGNLDAIVSVARRREQRRLRQRKFGSRAIIRCDLCGRHLPARLITAAHIKRRADAMRDERLNLANVMAACLLGCDALFEHGLVYVDPTGLVRASAGVRDDLEPSVRPLTARPCTAFDAESRSFFRYHAARTGHPWFAVDAVWPTPIWKVIGPHHVETVLPDHAR